MSVILSYCAGTTLKTPLALAWVMLFLNIPIHYGLYFYLDQIMPDTYGIRKHPCFCFRKQRA